MFSSRCSPGDSSETQIPFGNDKQEEQLQRQRQIQVPFGNDLQEGQLQRQTQIRFGSDKQRELHLSGDTTDGYAGLVDAI